MIEKCAMGYGLKQISNSLVSSNMSYLAYLRLFRIICSVA